MMLYIRDDKVPPEILGILNNLSKVVGQKIKLQKSIAFLYTYHKNPKKKIKDTHNLE